MKILYSTTYQNKTVYRLYASDMNNSDSIFLRNESDGLWAYNISQNWSQFIYKYPVNVGEWWIGGGNGDTVKCISTNETVVTLSGTHTGCIKYQVFDHYQGNVSFSYEYVKPGLGPVGSDHYNNSGMSITQTFFSYPGLNKFITNAQPVFDTIYASILQNNIANVKLTLGDVSSVEVNKIKFSLWHNGIEVSVIDALTKTGVGSFINTSFNDSATTPIDMGTSPYTGTFKPQHPLSTFNYADAGGQWILKIIYTGSLKTGLIRSWSVTITYTNQPQTILQSRARLKEYHLYP